jgi:hypothetical protein
MELEVIDADVSARPKLRTRLESYRAELKRLGQDFSKARAPSYRDGMLNAGTNLLFLLRFPKNSNLRESFSYHLKQFLSNLVNLYGWCCFLFVNS